MWKVYFVALIYLSINKWILVAVLKHKLGIQVIWELDIEFHFLLHCSVFTWCQARLSGPDLREREKKKEIKTRLIHKLESGSVLSNPVNAFLFLIHLNHTPVLGQSYFEQDWVVWCLLNCRTVQKRGSLSPWGVCLAGIVSTQGMHADKAGLPTEPHCTHCWNVNPSGWYLGAAIKKKKRRVPENGIWS